MFVQQKFAFGLALWVRHRYGVPLKNTQQYYTPKHLIRYILTDKTFENWALFPGMATNVRILRLLTCYILAWCLLPIYAVEVGVQALFSVERNFPHSSAPPWESSDCEQSFSHQSPNSWETDNKSFPFVVMLVVSLQITLSKSNLSHKKLISTIKVGLHSQCSEINKSYLTLAKWTVFPM